MGEQQELSINNHPKILGIPKGNGEKISEETSHYIEHTSIVCANCLNANHDDTRSGPSGVRCMSTESRLKGLLNTPTSTCSNYE